MSGHSDERVSGIGIGRNTNRERASEEGVDGSVECGSGSDMKHESARVSINERENDMYSESEHDN